MSEHFPEIIGLTFAGAVVLIFVFASEAGSPELVLATSGAVIGAVALLRNRIRRRRA